MSALSNIPFTDCIALLLCYKFPLILVAFRVEPNLSSLLQYSYCNNLELKTFFTILTSIIIIFSITKSGFLPQWNSHYRGGWPTMNRSTGWMWWVRGRCCYFSEGSGWKRALGGGDVCFTGSSHAVILEKNAGASGGMGGWGNSKHKSPLGGRSVMSWLGGKEQEMKSKLVKGHSTQRTAGPGEKDGFCSKCKGKPLRVLA